MPPKARLHQDKGKLKSIPKPVVASASTSTSVTLDEESQQQFEVELYWCIQQLQNAISSNKLNQKQLEDATKNLKILSSKNSSIVQKRQLMRTTFGDYRKKMSDEEKKYNKVNQQNSLKTVSPNKNSMFVKKSVFLTNQSGTQNQFKFNFEKSSATEVDINTDAQNLSNNMNNLNIKKNTITFPSDNSFRFNFGED